MPLASGREVAFGQLAGVGGPSVWKICKYVRRGAVSRGLSYARARPRSLTLRI